MSERRLALITGASSGLGAEYARLFAGDGHDVVLVARRQDRLQALADELRAAHEVDAHPLAADLSQPDEVHRVWEEVCARAWTVEFLVNCAGYGSNGRFVDVDVRRELDQIGVNVQALTALTRLALPGMLERGRGRILNVASTAGFQPGPGMAVYYASKAYVLSFSQAVSHELRKTGVTLTCHCPGAAETEFGAVSGNATSNLFRAGVADAKSVARHGYRAMMRGKTVSVPGALNWMHTTFVGLVPRVVLNPIVAWVNAQA